MTLFNLHGSVDIGDSINLFSLKGSVVIEK